MVSWTPKRHETVAEDARQNGGCRLAEHEHSLCSDECVDEDQDRNELRALRNRAEMCAGHPALTSTLRRDRRAPAWRLVAAQCLGFEP
jgi:hypothetical protein